MKFSKWIFLVMACLFVYSAAAQDYDYNLGIGARVGLAYGINVKYFLRLHPTRQPRSALEGIFTTRFNGANASVLFEYHNGIFDTEGLNMYIGGGAHLAVWNSDKVYWETDRKGFNPYAGLDGIIGIEYVIADIPVAVSLDWKPAVNFISDLNLMIDDIGLSVRYLFK
jgi:hypothetical protein